MSRNAGRCGSLLAAVLALWSAFPAPAMAETLSFNPSQLLGAGSGPWAIAVRDFNGDGINDLAVVNYQSDNISVFLGNGGGTFRPPVAYAVGDGPTSIEVGNFNGNANGDGTTDLVVANYLSTTVTVLMSNGDGTFQPPRTFDAGISPAFVAVADFNGDYNQDLVVVNFFSTTIAVLLGNGDGTFQLPQAFYAYLSPAFVAVGDFTGGGRPDLAVANYDGASVAVLLNTTVAQQQVATPTFSPPGGAYASPQFVAISDATPGATIYYTTDGSTPTSASSVYSGPIAVAQTTTIKAMAAASGMSDSAVASATYTILQQVATPTFSPAGGTYVGPITVTLSDATSGATIHYTTNGSTPTASSPVYSGPIAVTQTTTIKAMAAASGMSDSAVASATYTIRQRIPPSGTAQVGSTSTHSVADTAARPYA